MEFYDSQYLIIIIPAVVIAIIFLFFWLFMKETSYDEILAKQKRDIKLVPAKVDKKKNEKKKKKKENPNGNLHESDSESAMRDIELMDALTQDNEPPVHVVSPVVEVSAGLKERRKKDKKTPRLVLEEPLGRDSDGLKPAAKKNDPFPVTKQPTPPEMSSSKRKTGHKKHKNGAAATVSEQFDSSQIYPDRSEIAAHFAESKGQGSSLRRQDNEPAQDVHSALVKEHAESVQTVTKKQESVLASMETKLHESGLSKRKTAPKKPRVEPVSASVENLPLKCTVYTALDNAEGGAHAEKRDTVVDDKNQVISSGVPKPIAKKQRNEYDTENTDIKFKDFLSSLKTMTFTEEEAIYVADILKEKASVLQEIWQKPGVKCDPVHGLQQQLQEQEKLLQALQDEVNLSNDKCKQLNQELVTEKQKANVVETKLREQRTALEKELAALQNKLQVSYQDHMNETQMQFRQLQDQTEALKQENRILRDAVSKAPTQMESKQSTELNKLRQDYARLMNEFTEKTNRLQQEEAQKKNLEVSYEQTVQQLKTQLQEEVERRQEDMQKFLRNVTAEHEKRLTEVQGTKQDLQSKLLVAENELGSKTKEIQSLHSKLTDTMVSKQQLEQKIMQLVTAEQKRATADEALKKQVQDLLEQKQAMNAQMQNLHAQVTSQASAACVVDELQKKIVEQDKQIKLMEESLEDTQLCVKSKEEDIQSLQKEKNTLTAEVQKLQVQTSEQASALCMLEQMQKGLQERNEKIKTVEELLETGLIEVANKGAEIENLREENRNLNQEIQELQMKNDEQVASASMVSKLQKIINEKNEKINFIQSLLESKLCAIESNEKTIQDLQKEKELLSEQAKNAQQVSTAPKLDDLEKVISMQEQEITSLKAALTDSSEAAASKMREIQGILQENDELKLQIHQLHLDISKQADSVSMVAELKETLVVKDTKIKKVEDQLEKELLKLEHNEQRFKELQDDHDLLKKQVENVQLLTAEQVSTKANLIKESQAMIEAKEQEINNLKALLSDSREEIASYVTKLQDFQHQNAGLKIQIQQLHEKTNEQDSALLKSEVLLNVLSEKDKEIDSLLRETDSLKTAVNQQRKKNNELREKNWKAMEALTSTEKMLQDKVNKTAKEKDQQVAAVQSLTKDVLKSLFPRVLVPSTLEYSEWLQEFEIAAQKSLSSLLAEQTKVIEHKEKEGEEMHAMLQLECEKYKTVLAETEGILQRLQSSVEEEEGKWKLKLEESQKALIQMQSTVCTLEQELEMVKHEKTEAERLRKQNNHLASELEKVESERATCVTEVRELKVLLTELQKKLDDSCAEAIKQNEELSLLKTQLSETLTKLKIEQNETQNVVSSLYKAQECLNGIQAEIARTESDDNALANSDISEVKLDVKETSLDLDQNIIQLQQLLKSLILQLSKGRENSQHVTLQLDQKVTGVLKEGDSV
ncbi:kinectin isoform X1 [Chiloscyllium plagiosum]|uniref:kinectin isoform X1 n=1 Tax=Chiloscyllium plagiosum TaxID=36176 RepID=UPI001CB7DC6A|nr:kinectin isoform X1 [Chiloscyllium plagiosum]XP_043553658.1 kinectin isoform X1 [Chiloscyllium plagiosum]XP_043553659.1 kinectin isoform X1 [Chiloscyllium plagiosum]XP_043553660.1 kinectin isoform X1 [Chiloscyllium plagiosum]